MVDSIDPAATFQRYPTTRLWQDIKTIRNADLKLVNLFPPPLPMSLIVRRVFLGRSGG